MGRFMDQRGVAMVTVLLVGAVLTVVSSTAAFVTIKEFNATNDDLKATRALGYAEAGLDRALVALRQETWNWEQVVMAGCPGFARLDETYDEDATAGPDYADVLTGSLGDGTYNVVIERDKTENACPADTPDVRLAQVVSITSTGRHPEAMRKIQQTIELRYRGLPIGLYAEEGVSGGGSGDVTDVSLITPGNVDQREKISFAGFDPFYKVGDFYPATDPSGRYPANFFDATERALPMPAAAHAIGPMQNTPGAQEHPPAPRCNFNGNKGTPGQSVWDSSGPALETVLTAGCSNWVATWPNGSTISPRYPPVADFNSSDLSRVTPSPQIELEDFDFLKGSAESSGLYCSYLGGSNQPDFCTGWGGTPTGQTLKDSDLPAAEENFVVYIDMPPGTDAQHDSAQQTIVWQPDDFAPCTDGGPNRSVVLVVRHGSVQLANGSDFLGAIIAPEGTVSAAGNHTTEGTIIARRLNLSGTGQFKLSECWLDELKFTFIQVNALGWRELDR